MKERQVELLKVSMLLVLTGLLVAACIQLCLGEVGFQILGVRPI